MKLYVIAACTALAGCAVPPPTPAYDPPTQSASTVAQGIEIEDSGFDRIRTIVGPPIELSQNGAAKYRLRAFVNKESGATDWQVYADLSWGGGSWRFYRSASLEGGQIMQGSRIDTDVSCGRYLCSYREVVGFMLPANAVSGDRALRVRVNAQKGPEMLLTFPAEYQAAMLKTAKP